MVTSSHYVVDLSSNLRVIHYTPGVMAERRGGNPNRSACLTVVGRHLNKELENRDDRRGAT